MTTIGKKNERISLWAVGLLLLWGSAAAAQSAPDAQALQKEIDVLKAGQQAIQKDLAEIKKLLQNQRAKPSQPAPFKPQDVSIKGAPFLGEADAKLTLVEFTDYQCSFCKRHFTAVLPQIKKDYVDTGKLKYVMRQFPLVSIHPRATKASEAALCAGDQGKYWEVHYRIGSAQPIFFRFFVVTIFLVLCASVSLWFKPFFAPLVQIPPKTSPRCGPTCRRASGRRRR